MSEPVNQREEYRKLKEEETQILEEMQHLRETLKGEVEIDTDEADPDLAEREKSQALISALQRKLESIRSALRLIEKGLYGICERCGEPINPERLEVRPDATLCLECQREAERIARRGAGRSPTRW